MSSKSISVIDGVSTVYLGIRAGEPVLGAMMGTMTWQEAADMEVERFGFWSGNGFAVWESLKTYVPVIMMQGAKKLIYHLTGKKSFRIGPFRFP